MADNCSRIPPPPCSQTTVTIVGKYEVTRGKIWLGHFWYTHFLVPAPPPPPSLLIHPRPPPLF